MIHQVQKGNDYVITLHPETKEEFALLEKIKELDMKARKERDYWTLPPVKKKEMKQMTLADLDTGWQPLGDDEPFAEW